MTYEQFLQYFSDRAQAPPDLPEELADLPAYLLPDEVAGDVEKFETLLRRNDGN